MYVTIQIHIYYNVYAHTKTYIHVCKCTGFTTLTLLKHVSMPLSLTGQRAALPIPPECQPHRRSGG